MTHEYPPLRLGRPIWLGQSSGARQSYSSLKGRREADVVVIGGGMTGALIALTFAAEEISVVLLEGALVGRGSSGASSALLLQEPDQGMAELTDRYGARTSRQIWQASHDAVRDFVGTLGRLHI
jgi:glycine/D-amino acid oxidase-like deaminating enzyme